MPLILLVSLQLQSLLRTEQQQLLTPRSPPLCGKLTQSHRMRDMQDPVVPLLCFAVALETAA